MVNSPVEMVSAASGDPTPLQFRNTDAELYHADLDFVVRPVASIELAGTASYTSGQRRDIANDLYRIPPVNLRIAATWSSDRLALGAEMFAAANQDRESQTNYEPAADVFAVVGLFGRYGLVVPAQTGLARAREAG